MGWVAVVLLVFGLTAGAAVPDAEVVASDSDVLRGIVLAEAGHYDAAIDVLEGVVVAPPEKRPDKKNLAVAYAYLGVARSGKGEDDKAKEMFAVALGLEPRLVLSSPKISPRARKLFETVKEQVPARPEVKRGGGSPKPFVAAGLVVVGAGAGAYVLSRDSGSDVAPAATTKTDTITGLADYQQPGSSVTLGPTKAGPWTAKLTYEDPRAVFQLTVLTGSSIVASARQDAPTSILASWSGAESASYRIDWSLAKSVQQAKYTLTVTHPLP